MVIVVLPHQIESWARRVLEKVEARAPVEDARVELKAAWPEAPNQAARQIAAHANAAGGASILWLIGADQKTGICGASAQELANWLPGVQSHFDTEFPAVTDL